jgi:transglutaminase-like putative cysteine protease
VQISNWVRNSVQWVPTWGSLQGADAALRSLRANAFDTASLQIALLRAAGIPARYQFGTIDVPAATVMNWVGGVQRPEAALNLLNQGGIAARGVTSGGVITSIRMEHVWVSAYVNWSPSRGARDGGWDLAPPQHPSPNAALNAWVRLDASYKQYTYTAGVNLAEVSPFNAQAMLDASRQGATCTASSAAQINLAALSANYAQF